MSGSHIISTESKGISGVSSASGSSSGSAAIAISSSLASSSSSSTSSSSSCESGIVIGDSFALSLSHSELVGKSKVPNHIDIVSDSSPAIKGDTTNSMLSTQITPKLLNEMNMAESIHNLNQAHHHQMLEPTKVITSLPLSEDPRTLQLALELSLVGLNENRNCYIQPSLPMTMAAAPNDFELGSMNVNQVPYARGDTNNLPLPSASGSGLLIPTAGLEDRSKKSQNMTECVPVPSSEHVAEIVGRQGCKIKALRAKTNTYIKTPVRGEEPVFVVTGRKEDVNKAKREILSAADHFSLIRASRKPSIDGHNSGLAGSGNGMGTPNSGGGGGGGMVSRLQSGPPCLPGQITIQVRVPYRVVGLVVGPKGATIKHIQQETQTYIVTPSREKEPIFEVTGLPENVEKARKQIEAHIALRTGNGSGSGSSGGDKGHGSENGNDSLESNEFSSLHTINSLTQILNDDLNPDILSSIYKNGISPSVEYSDNTLKVYGNGIGGNGMVNCIDADDLGSINSTTCTNVTIKSIPGHLIANCFPNSDLSDLNMVPMLTAKPGSVAGSEIHMQSAKANHLYRNTTTISANKSLSFCPPTSACASASASASGANILTRSCSSASSTASTKSTNNSANSTNSVNTPPELLNLWKNLSDSIDIDEGIGDSPSIWNLPPTTAATAHSHCSPTASVSPTDSLLGLGDHAASTSQSQRIAQQAMESGAPRSVSNIITANQLQPNSAADKLIGMHRECFVCNEREVTTALVPCGHNMFCMECANQICVSVEAMCPVCHSIVYHAMRILG
ncbi:RNA-binding protein MEX3B [Drosophila tropicalis]|uniref:RNA-binding protein MEX3B n=1 Tax=Drosophila tropicalis TaxID=46794 RepID=UPI0035AB93D5